MKHLKKITIIITILLICILPTSTYTAATKQYNIKVTTTYKIQKGEKIKLYVKGYKNSKKIKWKSSKKSVATVSQKGVVTGKKGGTTKITATIGNKKFTIKVIVFDGEKMVYENDVKPDSTKDRYDFPDYDDLIEVDDTSKKPEWITSIELEDKYGVAFISKGDTLQIIGSSDNSITGMATLVTITDVPVSLQPNVVYGIDIRYKFDGKNILFNTSDLKKHLIIK